MFRHASNDDISEGSAETSRPRAEPPYGAVRIHARTAAELMARVESRHGLVLLQGGNRRRRGRARPRLTLVPDLPVQRKASVPEHVVGHDGSGDL